MATTYKRLAAAAGNGTIGTAVNLYTATGPVVISTILVCNASTTAYTFTLAISTASATYQAGGYLVYQATIAPNDTITLTLGITLDATNKYVCCSSSNAAVNFSVFGSEIA